MYKITLKGISKRFRIHSAPRVLIRMLVPGGLKHEVHVLSDVDIEAAAGDVVGIIGRNGSGKSTLLRIAAGIIAQDSGTVASDGNPLYLSGFLHSTHPYLTVRQNILLIGAILGVPRRTTQERLDEVAAFAGISEFLDVELFKLSPGMVARLNVSAVFHSMEHARPSTLLLDEVLSTGGDIEFREKSIRKLSGLLSSGAAVLLVSHDLELIERECRTVVWLEKGRVRMKGRPAEVVAEYRRAYAS